MGRKNNKSLVKLIKFKFSNAGLVWGMFQLLLATIRKIKWKISTLLYMHVLGSLGRGSIVKDNITLMYPAKIFIGENCHIGVKCVFTSENQEGNLIIENDVSLVEECRIDFSGNVSIGQGAHLSPRCQIITHDHKLDPNSNPSFHSLRIGRQSWIGNDSLILSGVSIIGDFAIVGAGSVVTRNVPSRAIVAGNPAKVVKYRNDEKDL